ncbi:PhzF family phenazine biosynthesis protein [Brachybacterium sp. J144]|uniref:PhzF family phenazine biosynthesis protein n=1 Tax=Brachybacterium sp. J144 TaxID=3116487 RepID=UPI002E7662BE|nr:PhzF family phenazine biosynthesis protein [Brachybacterium sp. J144]MEE1650509.1 PhzF family phenazine biosynthesis protein [Brachybacterium sp. J144]
MVPSSPSPRRRSFLQLDVFADMPQRGNPLAVVLDAEDLTGEDMARIARWTNLSETTFLLAPTVPGADYRVRIWTPTGELPFAGHPTLGTARAWLLAGGVPAGERIVQECAAGLITVRRTTADGAALGADGASLGADGASLAFAAPPLRREGPIEEGEVAAIAAALGVDRSAVRGHAWADNGPGWQVVELEDAERVLSLRPDPVRLGDRKVGVLGRWASGAGSSAGDDPLYEVRAFHTGGEEDPVTGSLNAGIGQWLVGRGEAPQRWTAAQGTVLGREGRITLEQDEDGTLWVGGATVPTVERTILV